MSNFYKHTYLNNYQTNPIMKRAVNFFFVENDIEGNQNTEYAIITTDDENRTE